MTDEFTALIADLLERVSKLETRELFRVSMLNVGTGSGADAGDIRADNDIRAGADLNAVGDIRTTAWADYSATSTVIGFTSDAHDIRYKRIGKFVIINYRLGGTGDGAVVSFTVPSTSVGTVNAFQAPTAYIQDAGVVSTLPGRVRLPPGSALVTVYKTQASAVFTAGGTRLILGQFWYQAA